MEESTLGYIEAALLLISLRLYYRRIFWINTGSFEILCKDILVVGLNYMPTFYFANFLTRMNPVFPVLSVDGSDSRRLGNLTGNYLAETDSVARKLVGINMLKVIWDRLYWQQEGLGLLKKISMAGGSCTRG